MTIKELEQILGIPRANIRFYEKERFINPARKENEYRDYSDEDTDTLKKIIIFRKLGLSLDQIKDILSGTLDLDRAMSDNLFALQSKAEELTDAMEICREIRGPISEFDIEKYWNEIFEKERSGKKFFDIAKDSIEYQKKFFTQYWGGDTAEARQDAIEMSGGKLIGGSFLAASSVFLVHLQAGFNLTRHTTYGPFLGMAMAFAVHAFISIGMWLTYNYAQKHPEKRASIIKIRKVLTFPVLCVYLIALLILASDINPREPHKDMPYAFFVFAVITAIILLINGIRILMHREKSSIWLAIGGGILIFLAALSGNSIVRAIKSNPDAKTYLLSLTIIAATFLFMYISALIVWLCDKSHKPTDKYPQ